MIIEKRDLLKMLILTIITCGIYYIYWTVKTKTALTQLGAEIPTAFLMIIPLANFYFWYKYSVGFAKYIRNSDDYVGYFVLSAFLPVISMFVLQAEYNKFAQ